MTPTIQTLRAEAQRLKDMAVKIDNFADELEAFEGGARDLSLAGASPFVPTVKTKPSGRFSGMTQVDAITAIVRENGRVKTRKVFEEMNLGGKPIKKTSYVTALMWRYKGERFDVDDDHYWTLSKKLQAAA